MKYLIISVLLGIVTCWSVNAQSGQKGKWSLHTKSKKAVALFASAEEMYSKDKLDESVKLLDDAIDKDPEFIEAYLLKADIYFRTSQHKKEIDCITKAIQVDSMYFVSAFYNMGVAQFNIGEYAAVEGWMNRYIEKVRSQQLKNKARAYIQRAKFAAKAVSDPVEILPINMGDHVNSLYDEYWPSISADGQKLVYTVLVPRDTLAFMNSSLQKNSLNFREDFYTSEFVDSVWTMREAVYSVNTDGNEGAQTLSADGNWMFFAACGRDDSKGSCDLYFSKRTRDGWTKPVNIGGPVNSPFWESQPSFSADGRTLFFVSSRPGGIGKKDIWKATLQGYKKDGTPFFGYLENMGSNVNTPRDENSPFIHHDNQTLYFSSDGWPGMGKMDLFLTRQNKEGVWSEPVNLGYPLNTAADEIGLVLNAKGDMGYFSSDGKHNGQDSKDLYQFVMPKRIRPVPSAYVKGRVFDKTTHKQLSAFLKITDLAKGKTAMYAESTDFSGEFLFCLPLGNEYGLNVEKEGYLFYSSHFNVNDVSSVENPQILDVYLSRIQPGERIVLRNVFFETDSYILKEESSLELDNVVRLLKINSTVKAEIGGHTDNVGTAAYNMDLAQKRAREVYNYLVSKGVKAEQLKYKGYGFNQPVDTNETEEGRANNRRTEVKIL
ncbi:OmpA family protein [Carboxylicivirga caseinilyticus]|uniref:OmpA family protein n=1 Tax=Carboxylicivirga caseinilyticus TaxID=3417572 RepID=UPI003D34AD5C|nr:PD40 domain-containing protein [Marinilabiliaceae bacterium A049]